VTETPTATTNVVGANRSANPRPNVPTCMAISLRSTIGPTTRNASRAVSENCDSDAATNASASEQIDSTTASTASASTDTTGLPATAASQLSGTTAFNVAAAAAPSTRKLPACSTSWRTDVQNAVARPCPSVDGRAGGRIQSERPSRCHNQPITQATIRLATNRASTISGLPGNATAVAVSTIGLIAGADSRNVSAAAGVTPRRTSAPATGTDAHSQPGSTAPAAPATGTASPGRLGNARAKNDGGTNTAIDADSTTPSTRNGRAWVTTAMNTVIQLCNAGPDSSSEIGPRAMVTSSSTTVKASTELRLRSAGLRGVPVSGLMSGPVSVVVTVGSTPAARRWFSRAVASSCAMDPLVTLVGARPAPVPLDAERLDAVDRGSYVREKVRYAVGPDESVTAYVCVPKGLESPAPAVFCHHQHASRFDLGKSEVVGLAGDPDQAYAHELAERGFVTIAPDAIGFEERNWSRDGVSNVTWWELATRLVQGRTLLAVCLRDVSVGLDYLTSRADVDPGRIGFIGHSYGGRMALWTPAFDHRITASVSHCGCIPYRYSYAPDTGV
jgi:dienelactone hydrolase